MLFRSYCTAAIAAVAATAPMAAAATQSSTVRGASSAEDSATIQHRVLAGATGRYLEQINEFNEDVFELADDAEPQARRLRELQSKGKGNAFGKSGEKGNKRNAAFELADGSILEMED